MRDIYDAFDAEPVYDEFFADCLFAVFDYEHGNPMEKHREMLKRENRTLDNIKMMCSKYLSETMESHHRRKLIRLICDHDIDEFDDKKYFCDWIRTSLRVNCSLYE